MRIPNTINKNILKVYEFKSHQFNNKLQSHDFEKWDLHLPKTLKELCVESMAKNWIEHPILDEVLLPMDRYLLMDLLPTDLPLELTVPKIKNNLYWKKCYINRWPKLIPYNVSEIESVELINKNQGTSNSRRSSKSSSVIYNGGKRPWKEHFLEMHMQAYLEKMKPEEYNAEKIKELSDLCGVYIKVLQLNQMQTSQNSSSKIPLNAILTGFANLTELSICFKQTYSGDLFSWNTLRASFQDIKLMGKGLESLRLHVLRITNSDIDCEKLLVILKPLLKHQDLKTLEFSHCKISDKGARALAKFILEVNLRELNIANNKIGLKGIEYIAYALRQSVCKIENLNLRLNRIFDAGGNCLMETLPFASCLTSVCISGCGFTKDILVSEMLKANHALEILDISNNNIGESVGCKLLDSLDYNYSIKYTDIRMCKIMSETEFKIQEKLYMNRKSKKKIIVQNLDSSKFKDNLNEEILTALETIFE